MAKKALGKKVKRSRSLGARSLSGKHADSVKGGITVTKTTDSSSERLFREALVGSGKHVKIT